MSRGEQDIIYIGSQQIALNGNIQKSLSQITDTGVIPDTENLLERFKHYRFFSEDRVIRAERGARGYGGTEILATGIKTGLLDAIVLVCDGVGTVITDDPKIVYGIGNEQPLIRDTRRINGLVRRLCEARVHALEEPGIDQVSGIRKAFGLGYKRVGVTLTDGADGEIEKYRQNYPKILETIPDGGAIYSVCYYPPTIDSCIDLAFTVEEYDDLWKGRKRLRKAYLNVLTTKGEELIGSYMLNRFGEVRFKMREDGLGSTGRLDLG